MKAVALWGLPVNVGSRTKIKQHEVIQSNGKQGRSRFWEMRKSKDVFVM